MWLLTCGRAAAGSMEGRPAGATTGARADSAAARLGTSSLASWGWVARSAATARLGLTFCSVTTCTSGWRFKLCRQTTGARDIMGSRKEEEQERRETHLNLADLWVAQGLPDLHQRYGGRSRGVVSRPSADLLRHRKSFQERRESSSHSLQWCARRIPNTPEEHRSRMVRSPAVNRGHAPLRWSRSWHGGSRWPALPGWT